ncbi:MAG TPA: tyrosine-type recombinase/integrase [Micromonosporaceae bacterium]
MSDLIPRHLTWLRAAGRSERTVHDRRRLLEHADARLPYGIDDADAEEWAAYLASRRWSAWTRHTYYTHAIKYYDWGVAAGYYRHNPVADLPRPAEGDRIPKPATDDELALALRDLPHQPWRMAVQLAAFAGLRCCEIVSIRREDCTAEWLTVRGKGGRRATVAMAPQLWEVIEPRSGGLLVLGARGRPLTPQMLTQMQGPVWRRIGLPEMTLHRFRHWFATSLLRQGADIRTVQELMRHRTLQSTQGYTAVVDRQRRAAVARLPRPVLAAGGTSQL